MALRNNFDNEREILAENIVIGYHGALILLSGLFIPLPVFLALCAIYAAAVAIYIPFRNEIKAALFRFFDGVATFFGFPAPPLIQDNRERARSEPDINHGHIHNRLRSNSQPITATERLQRQDESRILYRRVIIQAATELNDILQTTITQPSLSNTQIIKNSNSYLCQR